MKKFTLAAASALALVAAGPVAAKVTEEGTDDPLLVLPATGSDNGLAIAAGIGALALLLAASSDSSNATSGTGTTNP